MENRPSTQSETSLSALRVKFDNLKISTKIFIGTGIVLLFLVAVSIVAYVDLRVANNNFNEYRALARQTNALGRVQANLLYVRLGVKDYIISGSSKAEETVNTRLEATQNLVLETRALFQEASKYFDISNDLSELDSSTAQLDTYLNGFNSIVQDRSERNQHVDQLNTLGPSAEKKLTKIMKSAFDDGDAQASFFAGQTLRTLLLARLYANRFLVDNMPASATRAEQELQEFEKNAQKMSSELQNPERRGLAQAVVTEAASYKDDFIAVRDVIFKRNDTIKNTLDFIGPKVADSMEAIKLRNKARQDELGPRAVQNVENSVLITEIFAIVSLIIGSVLAVKIGRAISMPILALNSSMSMLASGDKTTNIPLTNRDDEIGQMAKTVEVFKENALEVDRLQEKQAKAEQLAKEKEEKETQRRAEETKEAEARAEEEKRRAMNELADGFEQSVKGVVNDVSTSVTQMQSTSKEMSASAEDTGERSSAVASASEEATANVQTVAAATEELAASISEIGRQVAQSTSVAVSATKEVENSTSTVESLASAAQKIGDVIKLISDIAEQTNLLALNATIEAARAGDAGKGFAVVASEVKSLASQTAKATEEISVQITGIQKESMETVSAIGGIRKVIEEMNEISATIASAVEEQKSATSEISQNVQRAATGTQEVSSHIGSVSEAASHTGSGANQVMNVANGLAQQADSLSREVDKFLAQVRAT